MMTTGQHTLDHALAYAAWGWRVIPIQPGTKRPDLKDWTNAATTDPDLIRQWWGAHPDHGIGIVTGEASDLFALDVDPTHGGDDTLADLEAEHGPLPLTVTNLTGSGGAHYLFRWPGFNPGTGAGRLGPGLDIRAEGGQIVAPPSFHPSGRRYEWDSDYDPMAGCTPQDAPEWLLDLLKPADVPTHTPRAERGPAVADQTRPGDRFAHVTTWPQLLEADGATCMGSRVDHKTGERYELWCRPGKNPADGASATLYYGGTDLLKVFSSAWPGLTEGQTYTKFGYYTATRHHGDHTAAARELGARQSNDALRTWLDNALRTPSPAVVADIRGEVASAAEIADQIADMVEGEDEALRAMLIDWTRFWSQEHDGTEWIIPELVAEGRSHAIYAPAKVGKSLLLLAACAAVATGKPILGRPNPHGPRHVLYVDYEMSEADVYERLSAMGYSEDDDLSHFHYASLPSLPPLDTFAGGAMLLRLVRLTGAELLAIDTFGRAVEGEENSADTVRAFYRHTGLQLKALGVAFVRVDHAGKDGGKERGMRGSSSKNDDVDLVWRIEKIDGGLVAIRTHARMGDVQARITYKMTDDPNLAFKMGMEEWPAGTKEAAAFLDQKGIGTDVGYKKVWAAIKDIKGRPTQALVRPALKYRRQEAEKRLLGKAREVADDDDAG